MTREEQAKQDENLRLPAARHVARDAMHALGMYAGRDTRMWNLDELERHANAVLAAVKYFRDTGTK
jgi:hypothetical protein